MREIKTAVITGATGMIGTALTEYLLSQGITVAVCVRPGSDKVDRLREAAAHSHEQNMQENSLQANPLQENLLQEHLHIIEADLEELHKEETYERIYAEIKHADAWFHLGWAGTFGAVRNDMFLQNQNIRYTLDAVKLAKRLGCQVFLGTGSQAEYGRVREGERLSAQTPAFPENGYGIAKLAAGQMSRIYCQELGMSHIWMRILSVYGPRDTEKTMVMSAVNTLLEGGRPVFSPGEQLWDYLYVKDAARALYLAAASGVDGSIYPLGGGKTRPLKDYIMCIKEAVNPAAEVGIGELPYNTNQVMYLCADIEELTKDTGFVPEYTFEEGIRETVAWQIERKR